MIVQSYLFFEGRCEEALEFYKKALGAKVGMLMHYSDNPDPNSCPATIPADKIMHTDFSIGETQIMASDGMASGAPKFQGFALTINAPDPAAAEKYFNALADGGRIEMPLTPTFFSPMFGMVADRFGVMWMVIVPQEM